MFGLRTWQRKPGLRSSGRLFAALQVDQRALAVEAPAVAAEGAGAAALAALTKERGLLQGRRAAVILTGQNIDRTWMQTVLAGGTPKVC